MFLLAKIGAAVLDPLGLFFVALATALMLRLFRLRRTGLAIAAMACAGLWVASLPVFAKTLMWQLERPYPPLALESTPAADVAILLGGGLEPDNAPRTKVELIDGSDRVMHAADLFRSGKVRAVLVSGGTMPWAAGGRSEAELMSDLLQEWGVPKGAIILESGSRNTRENAVLTAEKWGTLDFKSALLVTSASHMPRAVGSFQKVKLPVTPSSTDVYVTWPMSQSALDWLPDSRALSITARATNEFFGYVVYWWRGWL